MKTARRYRSQLLVSYKPNRTIKIRPMAWPNVVFDKPRATLQLQLYEYQTYSVPLRRDSG